MHSKSQCICAFTGRNFCTAEQLDHKGDASVPNKSDDISLASLEVNNQEVISHIFSVITTKNPKQDIGENVANKVWFDNFVKVDSGNVTSGVVLLFKPFALYRVVTWVQEQLEQILYNNAFSRFGMKCRIVLNPSSFHFGYVQAGAFPWLKDVPLSYMWPNGTYVNLQGMEVDLSSGSVLEFDLPWPGVESYGSLQSTSISGISEQYDDIWSVQLEAHFSASLSTASSVIPYTIYVALTEVEACVPLWHNSPGEAIVSQMEGQEIVVAEPYSLSTTMVSGVMAATALGLPILSHISNAVASFTSSVKAVDGTVGAARTVMEYAQRSRGGPGKAKEGTPGVGDAPIGVVPPFTGPEPRRSFYLGSSPSPSYIDPKFLMDDEVRHSMQKMLQRPFLSSRSTTPMVVGDSFHFHVQPWHQLSSTYFDYMALFSRMTRFWRGSIKYCLRIYCSPLTTWSIKLSLQMDTRASSSGSHYPYFINKVLEGRGTTATKFLVPFLSTTSWNSTTTSLFDNLDTGVFSAVPKVTVEVLSISDGGDNTPSVFMTLWRSAAEDFMFAGVRSILADYEAAPEADEKRDNSRNPGPWKQKKKVVSQMMGDEFRDVFPCFPGLKAPRLLGVIPRDDVIIDVEELMEQSNSIDKNHVAKGTSSAYSTVLSGPYYSAGVLYYFDNMNILSQMFLWNRGSVKLRAMGISTEAVLDPNQDISIVVLHGGNFQSTYDNGYGSDAASNGVAYHQMGVSPHVAFELPYLSQCGAYSPLLFHNSMYFQICGGMGSDSFGTKFTISGTDLATSRKAFMEPGRSFQLACPLPPYGINFYPLDPGV